MGVHYPGWVMRLYHDFDGKDSTRKVLIIMLFLSDNTVFTFVLIITALNVVQPCLFLVVYWIILNMFFVR